MGVDELMWDDYQYPDAHMLVQMGVNGNRNAWRMSELLAESEYQTVLAGFADGEDFLNRRMQVLTGRAFTLTRPQNADTRTLAYTHTRIHTKTHAHIHTYIHTHMYAYTHTHIHTHTSTHVSSFFGQGYLFVSIYLLRSPCSPRPL